MDKKIEQLIIAQRFEEVIALLKDKNDDESKITHAFALNQLNRFNEAYNLFKTVATPLNEVAKKEFAKASLNVGDIENVQQLVSEIKLLRDADYYILASEVALFQHQYQIAIDLIDEATKKEEYSIFFHYIKARAYESLNELEKAFSEIKIVYEQHKEEIFFTKFIHLAFVSNQLEEVIEHYQDFDTDFARWSYLLALHRLERFDEAINYIESNFNQLDIKLAEAVIVNYAGAKRYEKVIEIGQNYLDSILQENSHLELKAIILYYMYEAYLSLNQSQNAQKLLEQLHTVVGETQTDNLPVYYATSEWFSKNEAEKGLAIIEPFNTPKARLLKIVGYYYSNQLDKLIAMSDTVLPLLDKHNATTFLLLDAAATIKENIEVRKQVLQALESRELLLEYVYPELFKILASEDDLDEAIHYAYLFVSSFPNSYDAHRMLMQGYIHTNRHKDAINEGLEALKCAESSQQKEDIYANLMVQYLYAGELNLAYDQIQQINSYNDELLWIPYHAGLVEEAIGKYEEAINHFEFLKNKGNYPSEIVYRLAILYLQVQNMSKFNMIYEEAEQLADENEENEEMFRVLNANAFGNYG